MSQWNDTGKLESAMKAVVDALALAVTAPETGTIAVNTGQDDDELTLPSVVCAVVDGDGDEVVIGTGLHRSRVIVRVTSSAEDATLAVHKARAAAVFDAFYQDDIPATLAAAVSDFYCYEVKKAAPSPARRDPRGTDPETYVFVSELPLEIVWCGSDIG